MKYLKKKNENKNSHTSLFTSMSDTAVKMAPPLSFAYDNVGTYHAMWLACQCVYIQVNKIVLSQTYIYLSK